MPLEFSVRKKLIEYPVISMLGYGLHSVPVGSLSDDTTMTICEIESFIKNNKFDYDDIMKNYIKWVIHKFLFNEIYSFAGEIREVNLVKGNFRFAASIYLKDALFKIDSI